MKIALLSNINLNATIRMLKKDFEIYDAEGYGNELGTLMNPNASIHKFAPDIIFLLEDLMDIIEHRLEPEFVKEQVDSWFDSLEGSIHPSQSYYISDAYLYGAELDVLMDYGVKARIEGIWQKRLEACVESHPNVHVFPYRRLVEKIGEQNAFSMKMWYMGRILHSVELQKLFCEEIKKAVRMESYVPKKVLLVDLDNTLWGGLAGEADITPVILSEEHAGEAYKNLQRVILQMQKQGVILGTVSKNNEEDAMHIISGHPHMILRSDAFAIKKINWHPKYENIRQIAKELNLGLDSMVFFDDNPTERQAVKEMLPEVSVPEFPDKPEDLAGAMVKIWQEYFCKSTLTREDLEKTTQYAANVKREALKAAVTDFNEYLQNLQIELIRKKPASYVERITQLLNKTNQFNLTTRRHTLNEIQQMVQEETKKIFLYQVSDSFGDNGIVAVVIVDISARVPVIMEFVMSCRVMGKNIENAIMDDVEQALQTLGYTSLLAEYIPTPKNKPVSNLYENLGYTFLEEEDGVKKYSISLPDKPARDYRLKKCTEE